MPLILLSLMSLVLASGGGVLPQPNDVGVQSYYISNGGQLIPNSNTVLPNNFLVQAIGRGDPN
jgi:hypothetical protein